MGDWVQEESEITAREAKRDSPIPSIRRMITQEADLAMKKVMAAMENTFSDDSDGNEA